MLEVQVNLGLNDRWVQSLSAETRWAKLQIQWSLSPNEKKTDFSFCWSLVSVRIFGLIDGLRERTIQNMKLPNVSTIVNWQALVATEYRVIIRVK